MALCALGVVYPHAQLPGHLSLSLSLHPTITPSSHPSATDLGFIRCSSVLPESPACIPKGSLQIAKATGRCQYLLRSGRESRGTERETTAQSHVAWVQYTVACCRAHSGAGERGDGRGRQKGVEVRVAGSEAATACTRDDEQLYYMLAWGHRPAAACATLPH